MRNDLTLEQWNRLAEEHNLLLGEVADLRAELSKAKDDEHQKWVKALLKVLPEEKAVLFREICIAREALNKGDGDEC